MRPYDLRCEYRLNPLGIDVEAPRFSWKLKAAMARGVTQSARRIQVSDNALFEPVFWDSGEVADGASVHVADDGPRLKPRTRYWWKVQAWDAEGYSDGWSDAAWLETGLMEEGWGARWISAENGQEPQGCPLLRKEFCVDGAVRAARIYATAKGFYRLWVNGTSVGDALFTPGCTAHGKRIPYQVYDITQVLRPGDNAIGAMLGGPQPRELLLELRIDYVDGREQAVTTNGEWKAADGPVRQSDFCAGETYDARLEIPHWSEPGVKKGRWREVDVATENKLGCVAAQDGPSVRRMEEIAPAALLLTPGGQTVLDMGQTVAGFMRIRVSGEAGSRAVLKLMMAPDDDGNAAGDPSPVIQYTLRSGGEETYEPFFTFQVFRYAQIVEWPCEPDISAFTGVSVHADLEPTGLFSFNEEAVNRLQEAIVRNLNAHSLHISTGCPQSGAAQAQELPALLPTACFNHLVAPFALKWLRDLAALQAEDGSLPTDGQPCAAVICPWTLYEYYGDELILQEFYPMMRRWVEHARQTYCGNAPWAGQEACEALDSAAWYAHAVRTLAQAAAVLGYKDDEEEYGKLFKRVRRSFRDEFVTPAGRLACPTQSAHVAALHFDLLDKPARRRAAHTLKQMIEGNGGLTAVKSALAPYLPHALTDYGLHADACALVLNPLNHETLVGAGDWLARNILGIAPDPCAPGFQNTIIHPMPCGTFTQARGSLGSLYGEIAVSWALADGQFELNLTVPENTTATVTLPGASERGVRESGRVLSEAEGVSDIEKTKDGVVCKVGSGIYKFTYAYMG